MVFDRFLSTRATTPIPGRCQMRHAGGVKCSTRGAAIPGPLFCVIFGTKSGGRFLKKSGGRFSNESGGRFSFKSGCRFCVQKWGSPPLVRGVVLSVNVAFANRQKSFTNLSHIIMQPQPTAPAAAVFSLFPLGWPVHPKSARQKSSVNQAKKCQNELKLHQSTPFDERNRSRGVWTSHNNFARDILDPRAAKILHLV